MPCTAVFFCRWRITIVESSGMAPKLSETSIDAPQTNHQEKFDAFLPPFEREELQRRLLKDVYKIVGDGTTAFDLQKASLDDLVQIWAVFYGKLTPLFIINSNKEPLSQENFREDGMVVVHLPSSFSQKGEFKGIPVFTPADILPQNIKYIESNGIVYERH